MDSYNSLLERTRVPQPSLQRFAVISIFSKLRLAPPRLDVDSEPGREAISQCLHSTSPAVVDQSVRELCRLVQDLKMDLSRGLLELQSSLEGSGSRFVDVFVKGLGFLVRFGFQKNNSWRVNSSEIHPFVKILSCRAEVQSELVQQVLLFMAQNKRFGMVEVCEFLRPFVNFSVLQIPFSDLSSSSFVRHLISSIASLCCSFPYEAMPVFKLLMGCLKYFQRKKAEDFRNFIYFVEHVVDAHIVVLRHLVGTQLLIYEAQLCSRELLETILSNDIDLQKHSSGSESIVELSKRLLVVMKELGLQYIPELSSVMLLLFVVLIQSEVEHEQLSIMKLLLFLLKWKSETEYVDGRDAHDLRICEELLFIFPVINLMSSPSKSVKGAATDLLFMLEKVLVKLLKVPMKELAREGGFPPISRPDSIVFRLLQHLFQDQISLPSSYFLNLASTGKNGIKEMHFGPKSWTCQLREYSLWIVERRKSSLPVSQSQEIFLTAMPLFVSSIAGVLVLHHSLGSTAVESLAALGIMDPKLGVALLLAILFYISIFSRKDIECPDMLLKLLELLPSLASHSVMIPLIVQTILPMLHKDAKAVLYATGTRLLCKTWEINDRAFGNLQGVLRPKSFTEFLSDKHISISMAASIRDICRKDPDRGVDLILSVSACVESQDPVIQAIGLQSVAHLCESDVIDFYTAWDVIAKHVLDHFWEPTVAHSLCLFLKWGAMDAEAYPEASRNVLQILWEVSISKHAGHDILWAKTRASAFEALTQYEVPHIEKNIPDFKERIIELLLSEINEEVLRAMEGVEVKIITYQYMTRRRLVKEKRVMGNKIEKLLDVFPQVIFSSGRKSSVRQLPGAALLCLSFTPKDMNNQGASKELQDVHAGYENSLVEIAASLHLSRNVFVALLSIQSWKSFMRRWMRANTLSLDAKSPSVVIDKTLKAANDILKSMRRIAEESIPRSAENIALAMGAFCMVLPPSAHAIKSTASKFLLDWLFQYEHEYRQWSAAISLGLISSCLHITDHKQKLLNITGLLEVARSSKNTLVKGACGAGLGFSCQDLLTRFEGADVSDLDKETYRMQEADLLGKIVRALSMMICQLAQSSYEILQSISAYFPLGAYDVDTEFTSELQQENCGDLEEDIWGVAGLVLGLGSSVSAIYRAGAHDAVLKIKTLLVSWINPSCNERSKIVLSIGSCLALPIVVAFCQRVELMDGSELDHLVTSYRELISELVSVKKSDAFYQSLLMASCVGVGSLLACILDEGVHSIQLEDVNSVLALFKKCYSNPYPPLIHLGGMLGVVNALGAGAGILVHNFPLTSLQTGYERKESSSVMGPLLSSPVCEPHLMSMMQEIFLVAQNFDDHQMQQYAAWAISFLRHHLFSKEPLNADNRFHTDVGNSKSVSQSFSEDSVVMKLSLWLMHLNYSEIGAISHVNTVTTVLRCLSRSPRLPTLDWGAIIRRCMRYEGQVAELLPPDSTFKKGNLREECLKFSLAHANQHDPLLSFLDELSDLSRFGTIELNLQSCLLIHLADLLKIFSGSRIEKLFDNMSVYVSSSVSPFQRYNPDQKSLLKVSCWKGLYDCLDEASLDSLEYVSNVEKCMEVLFYSLPALQSASVTGVEQVCSVEEWSEAVRCLGIARRNWLLDLLQVDLVQGDDHFTEVVRKIQAKAQLVKAGFIPFTELGKLKSIILNSKSYGIWDVLVEVAAALQHADGSVKRQWLVDSFEISCITNCPSKSLQFIGLLSGSCCKYMPLLIVDRLTVLSDLPVTLTSLLSEDPNWEGVRESVVSLLFSLTERVNDWVTRVVWSGDDVPSLQPIDESENETADFLMRVTHHTCVSLKDYLPLEKQLRLANMVVV